MEGQGSGRLGGNLGLVVCDEDSSREEYLDHIARRNVPLNCPSCEARFDGAGRKDRRWAHMLSEGHVPKAWSLPTKFRDAMAGDMTHEMASKGESR
jgi:hypothetical protein